jgi:hypothetical protein
MTVIFDMNCQGQDNRAGWHWAGVDGMVPFALFCTEPGLRTGIIKTALGYFPPLRIQLAGTSLPEIGTRRPMSGIAPS